MSFFKDFQEGGDSELLAEILNTKGFGESGATETVVERIENDGCALDGLAHRRNAPDDGRTLAVDETGHPVQIPQIKPENI